MNPEIRLLLDMLDRAFDSKGWHGTTLLGALRGVTPDQAVWQPGPGRNSIWALTLHTAYWKYVVRRRLERARERGAFPRGPSNWPAVPEPTLAAWRADVRLLQRMHAELTATVKAFPPRRLGARSPRGQWTMAQMIFGVASHDLYHTGQIQLIKKLRAR